MAVLELQNFRQKYPQYNDLDDRALANKLSSKYTQYSDLPNKIQKTTVETPDKTISEKVSSAMPSFGQFAGGLLGGAAGSFIGRPYVGSAAGGVLGRGLGRLQQRTLESFKEKPVKTGLLLAGGPGVQFAALSPEKKKEFGKEILKTGAIEALLAPVGYGLSKSFQWVGRGIGKGLLGARVAQRGFERGFKKILNPNFYQNRIPKEIASKTGQFFKRLSNVTGSKIDDLLKTKYKNTTVLLSNIKDEIKNLYPTGTKYKNVFQYIDDFDIPKTQKELLYRETRKILGAGGQKRKLHSLWGMRKDLDKVTNNYGWKDDSRRYLTRLRRILNNPIKSAGDDISESFGRYSFVKEAESDLGKKFATIQGPTGEIYSQNLESFVGNLLSTNKDETIRMLKDLDGLLQVDDMVMEDLLDYAASEAIEKKMGLGVFQELLVGMLGGRKSIVGVGRLLQSPVIQGGKQAVGRMIPTAATELTE